MLTASRWRRVIATGLLSALLVAVPVGTAQAFSDAECAAAQNTPSSSETQTVDTKTQNGAVVIGGTAKKTTAKEILASPECKRFIQQGSGSHEGKDSVPVQSSPLVPPGQPLTPELEQLLLWIESTYAVGLPTCDYFQTSVVSFTGRCLEASTPTTTPAPTIVTYKQAENVVVNLIARLEIPEPQIQIGPEPSLNEWNMAVVGMPYWLWTTEATSKSTTVSIANYSISMAARRESVTFDPGDGTASITCTTMQPWTKDNLMQTAPGCGHTYSQRNEKGTNFTLRARARWIIDWEAFGQKGSLPLQTTATRDVHVGELQSVVVAVGNKAG